MSKKKIFLIVSFFVAALVTIGLQNFSIADCFAAGKQDVPEASTAGKKAPSFNDAVKAEKSHADISISPEQLSGGSAAARAPFTEVKVEKAKGENAYTVAEIFAKNKELNGKMVRVRGKVVRYHAAIMGRNWIHIQDGTGDPLKNTHDLVATSSETAKVGEVITVEGKLAANKDFGAGYTYSAIIEGAKLIK